MRYQQKSILAILLISNMILFISKTFAQNNKKPNIIFILTDDQRNTAMGYTGNEIIKTPEMDQLAQDGVYFENAIVTTPICAASRASILTGLHERTHGYTFQQGQLKQPYKEISYPSILKDKGYYTGFFGKFGVKYKGAKKLFDKAEMYDRAKFPDRRAYFYKSIDGDTVHLTRYTGHQAQEFIKNAPEDEPFCLSLSFSAPHAADSAPEQYFWQEKSNDLYSDITIPFPVMGNEFFNMDDQKQISYSEYLKKTDKLFNELPKEVRNGFNRKRWHWRYENPEKYQHSVKGYYRMISGIDDEIGYLRELLKEKGIADNTVIIFMGDNGFFLGERQLAGKWLMYDNSVRVPFIIYDPRVKKHYDVKDMVLNIDVPKTILSLAGVKSPKEYQGVNLMPYISKGTNDKKRKSILIEHLWELPKIPSSEGIRTKKWKYFRYRFIDAPEELYDLENDPLERKNLAQEKRYYKVVEKLRKKCDAKIEKYEKARLAPYEPKHYKK